MNDTSVVGLTERNSAQTYKRYPFVVSRAEGAYVYGPRGERALDLLAGYSAVLYHQWSVPGCALIRELLSGSDLVSNVLYSERYAEFVEKITRYTGYDRVIAKSDGGSVADTAVKGLFMHAARRGMHDGKVILNENYFHGRARTFSRNAYFDSGQSAGMGIPDPNIIVVPYPAGDAWEPENLVAMHRIEALLERDDVVGIFMEVHRGEGGPLFDDGGYCRIHTAARAAGKFLVVDDIQAGLYRCGHFMSWQEFGEEYRPDAVVLGKILGGGVMPVSALIGTEEFMSVFTPGTEGSTYGGFPPACAVASAILDYLHTHPEVGKRAIEIGARFAKNLSGIPNVEVTYRGALIAIAVAGVPSLELPCLEMLSERSNPRVFMKHGHVHGGRAYGRASPPILAITDDMIDESCFGTIGPVLERAKYIVGTGC